jgi:hypothetical protein
MSRSSGSLVISLKWKATEESSTVITLLLYILQIKKAKLKTFDGSCIFFKDLLPYIYTGAYAVLFSISVTPTSQVCVWDVMQLMLWSRMFDSCTGVHRMNSTQVRILHLLMLINILQCRSNNILVVGRDWHPWYFGLEWASCISLGQHMREWNFGEMMIGQVTSKYLGNNLSQCHYAYQKIIMNSSGIELGPL